MVSPHAIRFWSSVKLCILRATEKSSVVWASAGASSLRTSAALGMVAISLRLWAKMTRLLSGDPLDWIGCPPADRANSVTIATVCNANVQVFFSLGQPFLLAPSGIEGSLDGLGICMCLAFLYTVQIS